MTRWPQSDSLTIAASEWLYDNHAPLFAVQAVARALERDYERRRDIAVSLGLLVGARGQAQLALPAEPTA